MQVITTTELRTKSKQLVQTLKKGQPVELIHRSKLVGEIRPKIQNPKPFDPDKVAELVKELNLPELTSQQIEDRYGRYLKARYGKDFS